MREVCFALAHHFSEWKGGAELQANLIGKSLPQFKINYLKFSQTNNLEPVIDDNIYIYGIKKPILNLRFMNVFNTYFIHKLLDSLNSDIFYQRGYTHSDSILNYAKLNDKRFILGISMDSQCRPAKYNDNKKFFKNYIDDKINVKVLQNADSVISQTAHQQKLLLRNFSVESHVIPNAHQVPLEKIEKSDFPIITWIANLKKWKRPEIFLQLAKKLENVKAHFVFAGRNDGSNFSKNIIRKANELSNVTYLGELPFHATNDLLSRSHIFVNTSLPNEGFPNTFIQSWMRETPVVSLEFDPDNLLENNKLGFISHNFENLVLNVNNLIESNKECRSIGRRASEFAKNNYNIEKISKMYANLFS